MSDIGLSSVDPRRDRAFSIFYVGINIGAFFSPLVCGSLGEAYGWHYGFGAAGVGMLVGLIIYVAGRDYLPREIPRHERPVPPIQESAGMTPADLAPEPKKAKAKAVKKAAPAKAKAKAVKKAKASTKGSEKKAHTRAKAKARKASGVAEKGATKKAKKKES